MSNDTDILVLDGKIRENFKAQKDSDGHRVNDMDAEIFTG